MSQTQKGQRVKTQFRLLRYFSVTSFISMVVAASLLGLFYRQLALNDLMELAESKNVSLTQAFSNSLWPQFAPFVTSVSGMSGDELRARPDTAKLRQAVLAMMQGLSVVKVKVYNLQGLTVFSTEASQIGEDKSNNAGFVSARSGKVASELIHRDTFSAFEQTIEDRDVFSSYIPIRRGPEGPIEGVFELYYDITPFLRKMGRAQRVVVLGVMFIFVLLYSVLFVIARRADRIIKRHDIESQRYLEEIKRANETLEERVQKRTCELSTLHEINTAITSTLDLRHALDLLLERIDFLLPHSAATVRLFNKRNGRLEPVACRNLDEREWRAEPWTGGRGLANVVFETQTPTVIRNTLNDARVRDPEFYRKHRLLSFLGIPLIVKDEVLGVISFYTKEEHAFSKEEIEFLSNLSRQAAIAIHNSQLYEMINASKRELESINQRLERSLRELSGLYTALTPLAPTGSLNEMLDGVIDRLMEATGADAALVRFLDRATGRFICAGQRGFPDLYLGGTEFVPPGSALEYVLNSGEPIIASDIAADPRLKGKTQLQVGFHSCAFLPLKVRNEVRGIVHLASREVGYFNEGHKEYLMAVARQMGIAIENQELFDKIKVSKVELEKANRDLQRQEEIQELLKELSQDITSLDIDSLLKKLTEKVREMLEVDVSDVRVLAEKHWKLMGIAGIDPNLLTYSRSGTGRGRAGWILKHRQPLVIQDMTRSDLPAGTSLQNLGLRGYLGVPLFSRGGEVIGVLRALTYQPREFTQEEVDILQLLASGAGIALENAGLLEQIRGQAVELEKANKVKDEFLRFVSHDLRTPVNAVIGYTAMMQDGLLGEVKPEQHEVLAKVIDRSEELLRMINSLLEATRIEAGAVEVKRGEVALVQFLDGLRSDYDARLSKELKLIWDYSSELPAIQTDSEKLKHVLQNLINNAVKYTDHGSVTISARCVDGTGEEEKRQRECVEFKVTDTGIGISQESLPFIFEMFRQVEDPKKKSYSGVGLGLHIVKKFTELLGGKVGVESTPGEGSTFTVRIPCDGKRQQTLDDSSLAIP